MRRLRFWHRLEEEVLEAADAVDVMSMVVASVAEACVDESDVEGTLVDELDSGSVDDAALELAAKPSQNVIRILTLSVWHAT